MQWILALPAQKEESASYVRKPKQKNAESSNSRKSINEHDLQRSDNETGTRNTKTSKGMKTPIKIEKIPMFSPYCQSDYRMKGDNGKSIRDGIAAKATILPLSALKEGNLINIKKPKLKTEGTNTKRKSLIERDFPGSDDKFGTGNSRSKPKKHEKVPMFFPNLQNDHEEEKGGCEKFMLSNKKVILDLSALEEGSMVDIKKPNRRNEEVDDNRKSLIELNSKRSDNKISAANTTTNYGKRTSKEHEKVPMASPSFWNDFRKKGGNLEVDENKIANEKINSERKRRRLEKHESQDRNKKVDTELSCYGKIKSKRGRLKKCEAQDDDEEKIDPEPSCYGFDIGFGEEKLLADGKIRSKVMKKKVVDDKLLENDDDDDAAKTSRINLKKNEPQGDSGEKIDPELCCYGSSGKGDETATEKIKSKRKRKSKKCEPQVGNKEQIDPESCCDGRDTQFVENKQLADGVIKFKEKKKAVECELQETGDTESSTFKHKKKKVVEDKLLENDDDDDAAKTSRINLKKNEPQGDSGEKIDPELCCYWSEGKGDETATEKLKSNMEKIDPESCCDSRDTQFVENKQLADEIIKFKEKKKAVEDESQENGDDTESSKFKLKKTGSEIKKNTVQVGVGYVSPSFHNDSAKKIHAKPLDKGGQSQPFALPTSADLMTDKVEEDGSRVQINQQVQDECVFSVVLSSPENGNRFESISIKFKKKTAEENAKVRKACHCSQIDNVKKSDKIEALEHEQGLKGNRNEFETIKVKFTKNRKSLIKNTAEKYE